MRIFSKLLKKNKSKYLWDKYYQKEKRNIEVPNISIYEYLKDSSDNYRHLSAINYFNHKITFNTLLNKIDLCARALKSQGIREGDVVTICMANTPEAVISFYAVNKIGAIANMLHPLSAEQEIKTSLNSTKSVMLITIDLSYEKIKNIIDETSIYKTVIVSARDSMPPLLGLGYYLTQGRKIITPKKSEKNIFWDDFLERGKKYTGNVLVRTTKDQAAVILHSGGTTGTPKNIVLSNGNITALIKQGRIVFPHMNQDDSMLAILPIFHCFGLVVCILAPLCYGSCVVLIPQFDAKRFDKLLTKYNPTILAGVPTLYEALMHNKHMNKVDLSSVKYIICGGDTLSVAKNKQLNNFFTNHNCSAHVIQGYGMTETTGPVSFGALGSDKLESVGIPLPGNNVKIMDINSNEEVPIGEVGQICISGPTVMMGYLDDEKETNEVMHIENDGNVWVYTGDLGYMDEDGVIFFVQRKKRMLIVSGYNVYPSHVEEIIMNHKDVLLCGVVGLPHPYKVQVPKAYIVLKNGIKATPQVKKDIKEHCQKNLAAYMVPKEFEFRASLPKTMIGKVNYRELEKEKNKD